MKPETLQLIKDERADLAAQLAKLDGVIELLAGVATTGFTVTPALRGLVSANPLKGIIRAKSPNKAPFKAKSKAVPKTKGGTVADRRASYLPALEKCGEVFNAEELAHHVGIPEGRVRGNLRYWAIKGIVTVEVRGNTHCGTTYRKALGWRKFFGGFHVEHSEGKPATPKINPRTKVAKAAEAPAGAGPGMRLSRTAGTRQSPQVTALESLFAGLSGSYPAATIIEMVRKLMPDLVSNAEKETNLRVRLFDMATSGKIRRVGVGSGAHYSALPGRAPAPAAEDEDLRISVPRDADERQG